jgi:tetratricopeptide (TPR) repeat protein
MALERGRLRNSAGSADEAVTHFLTALQLAESSGEDALAVDAAHMLGIASAPDEQLGWNLTALARAESSRDPAARAWLGSLLNNIGWAHHDRGDYAAALDAFERAAAVRRERGHLAETRIAEWSVARAMRSLGRVDDALAIQSRLATELADAGESDPYVREELGECLVALGRHEEAIVHLRAAYDELSRDEWLQTHEPARLARLQRLAEGART